RQTKEYVSPPEALKEDVNRINKQFLEEIITEREAETLIRELILAEYKKSSVLSAALKAVTISEANAKIFAKFWADKYEVRYHADGGESARGDFERAFRAIE